MAAVVVQRLETTVMVVTCLWIAAVVVTRP